MARVLVTGAGGFIGANLVRALLARGDEVHVILRPGITYWRLTDIQGQIRVHSGVFGHDAPGIREIVTQVAPGVVYHLAHYGGNRGQHDEQEIRRVIVEGTAALYDACRALPSPPVIVHTGSSSEYGVHAEPMREDMAPAPVTAYGVAKVWATLHGEYLRMTTGLRVTTLRLFSAYGPYESESRLFPAVILNLMRGDVPTLAAADTARDFVYVGDVVDACLRAGQGDTPGVFNVGTGIESTLRDAVAGIQSALGTHANLVWGDTSVARAFDTAHWVADTTRASTELGWNAQTSLSEGTKKTVDWFSTHHTLYERL